MMTVNGYEVTCYVLIFIGLFGIIKQKDYRTLFIFGTATLFGLAAELFCVNFSSHYYYSDKFWIVLGTRPHHFELFGGPMWGLLMAFSLRIAQKFKFNKFMTSLAAGLLITSWDLFMDPVAVRLDGGFWTWVGKPIDFTISLTAFMGIEWVNFFGYFVFVGSVSYLALRVEERVKASDFKMQSLYMVGNFIVAFVFSMAVTFFSMYLDSKTHSMFSMLSYLLVWTLIVVAIAQRLISAKMTLSKDRNWEDWAILIFWAGNYIYVLIGLFHLNFQAERPLYVVSGFIAMAITMFFCLAAPIKGLPKAKTDS
jgi:hypothetical protein